MMPSKSKALLAGTIFVLAASAAIWFWFIRKAQQARQVPNAPAEEVAEQKPETDGSSGTPDMGGMRERNAKREKQILPVPDEILNPFWLDQRREAQLKTAADIDAFHDFKFTDRFEDSGIRFEHKIVEDSGRHHIAVHYDHGNGLAVADVDGDGLLDLYFLTQLGGNELWKNLGSGKFSNITAEAGDIAVSDRVSVTASFADIDNDADADLFVTTVREGNLLFENDGKGHFRDVTSEAGLDHHGHSSGAVFFDFNRDGLLDLFLCNVGVYTKEERREGGFHPGYEDAFSGHLKPKERNERSLLYENKGNHRFEEVSEKLGLNDESWTGDAAALDYNRDGWPDLYVLNMQGNDEFYENVEGKSFVRKSREVFPKTSWGAMGIGVFDVEHDGDMDIFITDMHSDMSKNLLFDPESEMSIQTGFQDEKKKSRMYYPESLLQTNGMSIFGNACYLSDGEGRYEEASDRLNLENYWPWGLSVGDLNADGFQDVLITASMNYPYRYGVNSLMLNNGGKKFFDSEFILGIEPRLDRRTAKTWFVLDCDGGDKEHPHCKDRSGTVEVWGAVGSRSSALIDLEGDGDLDIVTNEFNDRPMVLFSDLSDKKNISYLQVKLIGTTSNRDGIGTRIAVSAGGNTYHYCHDGKSGYLTQSRMPLYVGLGAAKSVDKIELIWPSGVQQTVQGPLTTNRLVEITEEGSAPSR